MRSEDDQSQAQVAEKSLPPTEGELYAKLDFGDFVPWVKPKGRSLSGVKTELRAWNALEAIVNLSPLFPCRE
ncbi:MAG: hypothetical protein IPK68_02065 [Bdellovibrionales bacterium]|nr:hypothetical protein [Bdellovibrionales bacterium]